MSTYMGISDLTLDELNYLNAGFATNVNQVKYDVMGDVIANRALIGFTTPGHTGLLS